MARSELTLQQEKFVVELCKGKDATEAAIAAGYAPAYAGQRAYKLKQNPTIKKRIQEVKEELVKKAGLDKDFVLNKWEHMIEVLGQEVQAMGANGEPIFTKEGEPATKFIEPHALRNVLRDLYHQILRWTDPQWTVFRVRPRCAHGDHVPRLSRQRRPGFLRGCGPGVCSGAQCPDC